MHIITNFMIGNNKENHYIVYYVYNMYSCDETMEMLNNEEKEDEQEMCVLCLCENDKKVCIRDTIFYLISDKCIVIKHYVKCILTKYKTQCDCAIKIHEKCMEEWLNQNKTCPLCLVEVEITPSCCTIYTSLFCYIFIHNRKPIIFVLLFMFITMIYITISFESYYTNNLYDDDSLVNKSKNRTLYNALSSYLESS